MCWINIVWHKFFFSFLEDNVNTETEIENFNYYISTTEKLSDPEMIKKFKEGNVQDSYKCPSYFMHKFKG